MESARRPIAAAMASLVDAMRGKFSARQGATSGTYPLSSKRGPRNFYKGKGAKSMGRISTKAAFVLQRHKIPQLMVPDLTDCELKPYVAYNTPKNNPDSAEDSK